jgi:hypothetical protein
MVLRRAGAGVAAALLLAGCTTGTTQAGAKAKSKPAPTSSTSTTVVRTTTVPSTLPVAPIAWTPCNGDLECGTLTVPLDYAKPQGTTIGIAVERHLAEDPSQRIGSLVINPGGPGVWGSMTFPMSSAC